MAWKLPGVERVIRCDALELIKVKSYFAAATTTTEEEGLQGKGIATKVREGCAANNSQLVEEQCHRAAEWEVGRVRRAKPSKSEQQCSVTTTTPRRETER